MHYFNNLKRVLSLFMFTTILLAPILSQRPSGGDAYGGLVIKGKIIGKTDNRPIEYATVAAYNKADNKLLSGNISDAKGDFVIDAVRSRSFYITVTFMGYKTERIEDVPKPIDGIITLKDIPLEDANEQLGAVDVVAKNRSIEYQLDKKVVDVASMITAASATAIEVLENVPSVKVDMDGTVALRGSTGFTVLIDGKPSPLESSDALRSLPASSILKIEIITNPSAKYQSDGTAGIINVIMKKNRAVGINGIVNTNMGLYGTYGGDFLLNYRAKKTSYNLGADYNQRSSPGTSQSERTLFGSDTYFASSKGTNDRQHRMIGLKGGIDYDLTEKDAITLGFRLGQRKMESSTKQDYEQTSSPTNNYNRYKTTNNSWREGNYGSINLTLLHKFNGNADHTIKAQVDYNKAYRTEKTFNEQTDSLFVLSDGMRNYQSGPKTNYQGGIDYQFPINATSKLEAGYLGRYEEQTSISSYDTLDIMANAYFGNSKYANDATATQNSQALYTTYSNKLGMLSYQLGIRGEYTYRVIKTATSTSNFVIDQWDLFPTLHLSYKLPHEHEVMASYSRRIERVRPWDLDPFITWADATSVRQGNPALKNQYIDAFEVGYMKQYALFYLSLEGYYRITHNKSDRIRTIYMDNVTMAMPYNIGKDYSLGIEGSINTKLFNIWDISLMGTIYDYRIVGEFETATIDKHSFDRQSFNWTSKLNNTFAITKNQQLQLTGTYNSKSVSSQGSSSAYYVVDGGYRIDFMQKKLSITTQLRDIFATAKRENFTDTPTIYSHDIYIPNSPLLTFTLTYRLNNYRPKKGNFNQNGDNGGGEEQ